ncbi:MAG TPA: parallel beta-helix domain-containing protein [Bryobacteraceae bacterium]|nr:parallel beta-helix domain-containing protein [Bryobacteraceae bacterium]
MLLFTALARRVGLLAALTLASLLICSCARKAGIPAGPEFQKRAQEALILAKPGDVIELPEGKLDLTATLSLSVENVTIRGKGMDKTILSFKNQKTGSAGMLVTAGGFTLEDLAIEDTKGDGVKINGVTGVTIRRVRAEWTGGPKDTNGSYGLYPVQCKNVLIEDSVVKGASDAGFYVGQSKNIIVRRNRAEYNVAGIEIENSQDADVYQNTSTNNTGGLLAFNLPDLPVKDGRNARLFENNVYGNNTPNFAPKGTMVAKVPAGTGVIILATNHIDVYKNTIKDNATANISIISYLTTENPINDPTYDPYTDEIYIHDNTISGGGDNPTGRIADSLVPKLGKPLPAILYDGVVDPKKKTATICAQNNGGAEFVNYDAAGGLKHLLKNASANNCALPPLTAVAGFGGN